MLFSASFRDTDGRLSTDWSVRAPGFAEAVNVANAIRDGLAPLYGDVEVIEVVCVDQNAPVWEDVPE